MKKIFWILIILIIFGLLGWSDFLHFRQGTEKPLQGTSQQPLVSNMKLTSPAFENNQMIPAKYTCDGENINPPLAISEALSNAQSLVLIVDDPDAPAGTWDHWIVYNINPQTAFIEENTVPQKGIEVTNSFQKKNYGGPCPPSGIHHYHFKLYALDAKFGADISSKKELEKAMENHILDQKKLIGLYERRHD